MLLPCQAEAYLDARGVCRVPVGRYAVCMEFAALAFEKNTHHLIADLNRWPSQRLARLACEKYAARHLEFRNNSSGSWNASDSTYHYQVLRVGPSEEHEHA